MMVIEAKHLMSGHEMTDTYAYTIQYALAGHSSCFLSGVVVAALLFFGCFFDRTDFLQASRQFNDPRLLINLCIKWLAVTHKHTKIYHVMLISYRAQI